MWQPWIGDLFKFTPDQMIQFSLSQYIDMNDYRRAKDSPE